VGIEVSGVDHVYPGVERDIKHALGLGHVDRSTFFELGATTKRHGAQDDFGYQQARMAQLSVLHVASCFTLHVKV
jgi:hypothetical protein